MSKKLRIGCRGTDFCRAQTVYVLEKLQEFHDDFEIDFVDIDVGGGGDPDPMLAALAAGMIDLHVRGAQELPLDLGDGVSLAACTERVDPFDVLITTDGSLLEDLPENSVLAVRSSRVSVQLGKFRDDLRFEQLGDTVDHLLTRVRDGKLDAVVVAAEDVETLGLQAMVSEVFPPDMVLPAAGQGSFALLVREGDSETAARVRALDHERTGQIVRAERAFLRELAVKPADPVGVHGHIEGDIVVLEGMLGDTISGAVLRDDLDGTASEAGNLGIRLAKLFVADGARDYIAGYE